MSVIYYSTLFGISIVLTMIYALMWHKHFDIHFTLMFAFIPVAIFGEVIMTSATKVETAIVGQQVIYIGGCYLMLFVMLSVLSLCRIRLNRAVHGALMAITTIVYLSVLTIGERPYFYKSFKFIEENGGYRAEKVYGPMHTVFYVMVVWYLAMSVWAMVYSYFKKRDVSRKILYMLFFPELMSILSFFGGKLISAGNTLTDLSYVVAQVTYLFIVHRICLYDIDDTVVDSMVQTGSTGFISFDFKYNYLGSNETAKEVFPGLRELTVDRSITAPELKQTLLKWLRDFTEDETRRELIHHIGDRSYLITLNYLYDGAHRRGYQFFLYDDTKNQQYISLLDSYNTDLKNEVAQKTAHIVEMHDRLIMSMATMVESRDNSTGGHIWRTSQGVRILMDQIMADGSLGLTEEFCKDIIKAAPMHDLGKIAVDDAILRKPGRFTPEEFEIMKTHAAEGARIVHTILEGTDDPVFKEIAENVAHYHHERWDGSGYPEGLRGEEIPLEARIMAIADVYDALVSKRVYKEKMSFEQADKIIMEGMGQHFDKSLEPYYISARPQLEAYYSSIE